jgi:hypothetical protein
MKDLIEALTILAKYGTGSDYPTRCIRDYLIADDGVNLNDVSKTDLKRLAELSFVYEDDFNSFASSRFGSN